VRPLRFVWSAHGLICETPVPLTPQQRHRAKAFALGVYGQRYQNLPNGDRRDGVAKVLKALQSDNFVERPVTVADSEKEVQIG
jgi:hypothetical protein